MKLLILEGIKKTRPGFLSPSLLYFEQKFDFALTQGIVDVVKLKIIDVHTQIMNYCSSSYLQKHKTDIDWFIKRTMIIYMGYSWGREGEGAVTAGGRISLSYLELMYKMKWGSLQL